MRIPIKIPGIFLCPLYFQYGTYKTLLTESINAILSEVKRFLFLVMPEWVPPSRADVFHGMAGCTSLRKIKDTKMGLFILHQAENFLLAEIPTAEEGVRLLLSKFNDEVLLHRQSPGQATTSTALPTLVVDAIYQAVHTA